MIKIYVVYKPKFLLVTKEGDREVRVKYGMSEVVMTLKKTRGIMVQLVIASIVRW